MTPSGHSSLMFEAGDSIVLLVLVTLPFLLSVAFTAVALAYARRRSLFDEPGQRRSHSRSTPRGGGVGPIAAWLSVTAIVAARYADQSLAADIGWLLAGAGLIAAISWIDDHRSLPVIPRLLAHLIAAIVLVLGVLGTGHGAVDLLVRLLVAGALVTATNFWNFMDGIDGLAVMQSAFCALLLVAAALSGGGLILALVPLALLAALLGFAPFNFPEARIFLGDVGSTTLGFAIAGIAVIGVQHGAWGWSLWPIIATLFLLDAGLTLLSRLLRGRRWYNAHREHLYQWLHRAGRSHPRVVMLYLACNLLLILPPFLLLLRYPVSGGWLWVSSWLITTVFWCVGRRRLLRRASTRPGAAE